TIKNESLDSFCEKFLSSDQAMLDGSVGHFFYDRVHLQAALEDETLITIGEKQYPLKAFFKVMIDKIVTIPEAYPEFSKEQLCVRLALVERNLRDEFLEFYSKSMELKSKDDKESKFSAKTAEGIIKTLREALIICEAGDAGPERIKTELLKFLTI